MDQPTQHNVRTIVADTARLLRQNKISKEDLAKMDKIFRDEVTAYASTVLRDEVQISLSIQSKEKPQQKPIEAKPTSPPPLTPPPKPQPKPEPEPVPKPVEPAPASTAPLTEEQLLEIHLEDARKKREIVSAVLKELQLERAVLLKEIELARQKEKSAEQEEVAVKKEEKDASASALRALEEKRWALEDRRQSIEKERWEIHKNLDGVDTRISETYKQQSTLEAEEAKAKEKIRVLTVKKEAKLAERKKIEEEKVFTSILAKKKKYEADWIKTKEDIKRIQVGVSETDSQALEIKKQIEEVEKQESGAISEQDRHSLEEKRWAFDAKLRSIEEAVWKLDAEAAEKLKKIEEIQKVFAEIQLEEESSKEKIASYLAAIRRGQTDRNS